MRTLYLLIPFAPLAGSLIAGLGGRYLSRTLAHWVTMVGVAVATVASFLVLLETLSGKTFNGALYTWAVIG
ncbi:MAG: NADH-quinone oxidoreductase subunit L, partial [Burkholderiaceae bacterium]|nr:NADH-quinone oxidoreductase subunit L [Burkholderiaceae bacterium]